MNVDHDYRRQLLAVLVVVAVPLIVFARVVSYPFVVWDDPIYTTENPLLNPLSPASVWRIWSGAFFSLYNPLTLSFLAAEAWISRLLTGGGALAPLDPRVFHVGCLLLHVANAAVVFFILRLLVRSDWAAAAGALLFAVHPVQVESVAWVSETKGLLSGLFALLAVWLFVRDRFPEGIDLAVHESAAVTEVTQDQYRGWATVCFFLALLAKPSAVVVPLVTIALDWLLGRRQLKAAVLGTWDWLLMALVWIAVTRYAQPVVPFLFETPLWQRPLIAGDALAFYLEKLVWPVALTPDHGRTPQHALGSAAIYFRWLIPLAVLGLAAVLPARRVWLAALGIFVAVLAPVLGLVTFHYQEISTVADRYLYLALLGPALAAAWLLSRADARLAAPLAAAVLVALSAMSWRQTEIWRDDVALMTHALEHNPRSYAAHNNLGVVLSHRGELEQAEYHLLRAIELRNERAEPHAALGSLYRRTNRLEEAKAAFRDALERDEDSFAAHQGLADIAWLQGDAPLAIEHYRQTVQLNPDALTAAERLARILATHPDDELRNGAEAVEIAQRLCQRLGRTNPRAWDTLAAAYAEAGQFDAAIQAAQIALDIARRQGDRNVAIEAARHLEQYRRGEPLRESPSGSDET